MLIDHMAAGIMYPFVRYGYYEGSLSIVQLNTIYRALRYIGRTAFPIFCFLLVEGFVHTKSRLRYALSLLLFGLLSEPVYDTIFYAKDEVFNPNIFASLAANKDLLPNQCNVYFTLLIGFLVIWSTDRCRRFVIDKNRFRPVVWIFCCIFTAIGALISYKISSDYDVSGVILISIFYMLKYHSPMNIISGNLFIANNSTEFASFPGFILMALYNGKRGRNLGYFKYLFYLFYPLHLLILYLCRCALVC